MKVIQIRALRGPNLWSKHTSIEATVVFSENAYTIDRIPGFETRLRERFPEIALLLPADRYKIATVAHVLEFAALGLQVQAGCPVTFSQTTQTSEANTFRIIVEYSEEAVGRLAFELSLEFCHAAIENLPFDLSKALLRLHALYEDIRLGPSTGAIVRSAVARGIPYRRLTNGSLVQFGWGSKQRRIQASESDSISAVAESIVQDKELTKALLLAAGIPVPVGRPVIDAEDAWAAACEIGAPVVVKPQDGNQGKGVTANLVDHEQVKAAYVKATEISDNVLVERYVTGHDYRLLVVGKKLVAAARRDPPQVVGDGVHSIYQLVEQINRDPLRSEGHANLLTKIHLDEISLTHLASQGLAAESIPAKGMRVVLRNNANLSTGGTATDVTDDVHPEIAANAVAAAQMVGLDICGIDLICESIMRPLEEQGGAIIEVNAAPGLRMHLQPLYGKGRPVGAAIIDNMFAQGDDARIPVIAVTGTNGKTTTVRLIANILENNQLRVGMTCTDGVFINGQSIDTGDCSGPKSARNVLFHPDVDAAVLETARGGMLREGLGFDYCQVAVVTNIGRGDHLGLANINTIDELAAVKRLVVENVLPEKGIAVLNADDPHIVKMAAHCPGTVMFFSRDSHNPVILSQRAQRKRVIYLEDHFIVASEAEVEQKIPLSEIPLTKNGLISFQVENAMAAIAVGWALGLEWAVIRAGLTDFISDTQTAPGRFNLFNYRNATLIADYGHNPDAMEALASAIDSIPAKRRMVVISAAGDRRDEDIRLQTQILGEVFDEVVLYQDKCQRGRDDGEVLGLLRAGLENAKRVRKVSEIHGEFKAIDTALTNLQAGELCLILVDQVEQALGHIHERIADAC
ncbi:MULTISPECIES: cyanophycin synthetase [Nitrosomonas]|uniref:Cyanophycin synthetase n=1 Tax=Nitrosomonas communis TaxID=44574 RepID=A0A0F7KI94_9PROT|nr:MULTISPECIES: cyanophycin synthetase [Nitrosomonas]AKH38838.1 cyanophycin synthetase [Nitrosomonas communis]TYP88218.1 cyanophycin synthetase [Nitrosomonas communis]UVS60954.1 cyanophycin synthetase [Nitrosomonas sp. PLL12]